VGVHVLRFEKSNFKLEEIVLTKSLGIRIKIGRSPVVVLGNLIRVGENNSLSVPAHGGVPTEFGNCKQEC